MPCPFPFLFPLDLPGTVAVTLELFELLLDTVPLALEGVPVVVALEGVPAVVALEGVPVVALEGVPLLLFRLGL